MTGECSIITPQLNEEQPGPPFNHTTCFMIEEKNGHSVQYDIMVMWIGTKDEVIKSRAHIPMYLGR